MTAISRDAFHSLIEVDEAWHWSKIQGSPNIARENRIRALNDNGDARGRKLLSPLTLHAFRTGR